MEPWTVARPSESARSRSIRAFGIVASAAQRSVDKKIVDHSGVQSCVMTDWKSLAAARCPDIPGDAVARMVPSLEGLEAQHFGHWWKH